MAADDTDVLSTIGEDVPADQDQYLAKAIQRERVESQLNTGDTDPRVDKALSQPKPAASWRDGAEVLSERSGYATTFADDSDLENYARAKASGASEESALSVGDNGIGSDDLGRISTPYAYGVAVPRSELERYFGYDPQQWRRARATVRVGDTQINVPIIDEGPGNKAQAHGVVTDLSARLAAALKANGMEPAEINILRDAGPDYMSDRASWDDEQKRIRGKLGVHSSWQDGTDTDRPETTTGTTSWKSGTIVSDEKQPAWKSGDIASGHPVAQAAGLGATSWITKIWDQAKESMAKAGYGSLQARTTDEAIIGDDKQLRERALAVRRGDPYEKQIQDIQNDQFLSQQQKDEAIAVTRGQQAREQAKLQAQLAPAKQELLKAEAQVKADKPNVVESTVGQALPYLLYGVTGPAAPLIIAQQATAETYADMLDGSVNTLKEKNPSWSDSKVMIEALKATQQAAQASGQSQLALSVLDVPVSGPLISRIVKKIGIGAATMEIANSFAEVQKNMAIREHVDPKQDVLGQLRSLDFHLTNVLTGGAFSVGHALAEIGRPTTKPIDQRIADAQKIEENLKKPTVQPDMKAAPVEENGESGIVPDEPGAEQRPETADTGRPREGEREVEPVRPEGEPGVERAVRVQPPDSRRWAELKPEEVQAKVREWQAGFDAAWVKFAPFFKALKVEMRHNPGGGVMGVAAMHSGVIALEVDPMAQAEHWHVMKQLSGATDLGEHTDILLRHELIHGAWMDAWRQQWVKEGSQGGLNAYIVGKSREINEGIKLAIAEARANHNDGLANYLEQATIASAQTYSPSRSLNPFNRAAEFIRQMVEARHNGILTEDYFAPNYNRYLATVKHAYETARAYLTSLAKSLGLTGGKGMDPLRKAVSETEQRLAEIGFLEDQEPVTPEDMLPEEAKPTNDEKLDTAYQKLKQAQGGLSSVSIGQLAQESGIPVDQLHQLLLERARSGRADLHPTTVLDLSDIDKSGALNVPGKTEPVINVTLRAGAPEIEDKLDLLGLDDTPQARALADRAIRADSGKETILVPAARTSDGRVIASEFGHDTAAKKAGVPRSQLENGYLTNTGRFVDSPMDLARQIEEGVPVRASWPGEEFFEANRDVIKRLPHTEELIQKLYDHDDFVRQHDGRYAVLNKMLKVWKRRNPGLIAEVDAVSRFIERYKKLPPMSGEAFDWLKHANDGLRREYGDQMRAHGFHVIKSDGSTRPFIGVPKDVMGVSRIKRPDVVKILSGRIYEKGTKTFTKAVEALYKEGQNTINQNTGKPYFEKPEDLVAWVNVWQGETKLRPLTTVLERAREVEYPSFFYTYSPQSMLNSLFWQGRELARLMAFGQKLKSGDKDLFDTTKEAIVNDLSLSKAERDRGKAAIEALQRSIYGLNRRGAGIRIFRGAASFGYAASPHTSAKIGLSMLWNIPTLRGLARTLYAIDQITSPFSAPAMLEKLRQMGLKQDVFTNISDDPYSVKSAENRATNFFTGGLRAGGHAFVQDVAKAVTFKVSRMWLESAIRKLRADPTLLKSGTRMIAEDIERRGIDPKEFMAPVVSEQLKDRFAGEDVQQIQTAYRPHDYPAWTSHEWGSIMFTFGHWAYDRARVIARDSVIPMVQAFRAGDPMLGTQYFGRLLGIALVSASGASEAWRQVDKLFGRQDNVATLAEINKALMDRNPEAFHMLTSRLTQDIVLSPVIGLISDVYQRVKGIATGTSDLVRTFNPFQPAPVAYLDIAIQATNAAIKQGGRLSQRQLWYYAGQVASIVKGYYDVAEAGMHIPLPGTAEARGHREYAWVRSRVDMFHDLHPEVGATQKGIYPTSPHASYLQNINEALLAGNVQGAKDEIHRYHKYLLDIIRQKTKDEDTAKRLANKQLRSSLESSLNPHKPIPGGDAGAQFRHWAKKTLPADEWERMKEINKRYLDAAHEAGVPIKP